jgi:hypothetical protein
MASFGRAICARVVRANTGPSPHDLAASRTLLANMADDPQYPPTGYSAVAAQPDPPWSRGVRTAGLLLLAGAVLGVLGGLLWAATAPRVAYLVVTVRPPTAYATNPETDAFVAADGIYAFIALAGGALLGLGGYLLGVRRFGPLPMAGTVAGALAAALMAAWVGNATTGAGTFNATLAASKKGAILHAPVSLGSHAALAFWPVAAGLVAGGLELLSVLRARARQPLPSGTAAHRRSGGHGESAPPGGYGVPGSGPGRR